MAMMCRTRLSRRFPARDSRWRICWPEEASIGAVPVQEAKWALVCEPGHVADVAEDPGGADRADAVEVQQAAAGRGDRVAQLLVAVFELAVEPDDVGEQFGGQLPPGPPGDVPRPDGGQQRFGLRGGQEPGCAAGNQLAAAAGAAG